MRAVGDESFRFKYQSGIAPDEIGRLGAPLNPVLSLTFLSDERLITMSPTGLTSWDLARGVPEPARSRVLPVAGAAARNGDLWVTSAQLQAVPGCRSVWRMDRWPAGAPPSDLDERIAGSQHSGSTLCLKDKDSMHLEMSDETTQRALVLRDGIEVVYNLSDGTQIELSHDSGISLVADGAIAVKYDDDVSGAHANWTFWDHRGGGHSLHPPVKVEGYGSKAAVSHGHRLAVGIGKQLYLFDLPDGGNALATTLDADVLAIAWRQDEIVIAAGDGTLRRLDSRGQERSRSAQMTGLPYKGLAISPSGRRILPYKGLAISPSGRRIGTFDDSGMVRIWNAATLSLEVSLASSGDGEWIAVTPGGAFNGSEDVGQMLALSFPAPLVTAPLGMLESSLRKPDLIRQRLAGSASDVTVRSVRPPSVALTARRGAASLNLALDVTSVSGAGDVAVFVEGRRVAKAPYCGAQATVHFALAIPASARLTAVAFDRQGGTSLPAVLDIDAGAAQRRPDLWAVLIGIGKYEQLDARWQLDAPKDAVALSAALSDMVGEGRPYEALHMTTLLDASATRATVRDALAGLAKMKPDDLAIVYLAGHGWRLPSGAMVLLTGDVSDTRSAAALGIAWASIRDQLEAAQGRVLVLLDACHAGVFSQDVVIPNEELASSLARRGRSGIVVFAAAKGRQFSYEVGGARGHFELAVERAAAKTAPRDKRKPSPASATPASGSAPKWPVGLFTGAVIGAFLDPAFDTNHDGVLQLSELVNSVTARVSQVSNGQQTPTVSRRELFGDFAIGPLLDQ